MHDELVTVRDKVLALFIENNRRIEEYGQSSSADGYHMQLSGKEMAYKEVLALLPAPSHYDRLPFGGSHAPDCPYRNKGECWCWKSDPDQNPELERDGNER